MSRKNISLPQPIEERAQEIINKRGFSGLSDLIAVLVREEYERRGLDAPATLNDASSKKLAAAQQEAVAIVEAHYGPKKRAKKKPVQ